MKVAAWSTLLLFLPISVPWVSGEDYCQQLSTLKGKFVTVRPMTDNPKQFINGYVNATGPGILTIECAGLFQHINCAQIYDVIVDQNENEVDEGMRFMQDKCAAKPTTGTQGQSSSTSP